MSKITISIHNTASVEAMKPRQLDTKSWVRDILITDTDGKRVQLTLFSMERQTLRVNYVDQDL